MTKEELLGLDLSTEPKSVRGMFVNDCFCCEIADYGSKKIRYCLDAATLSKFTVSEDGIRTGESLFRKISRPYRTGSYTLSSMDGINSDWPFHDTGEAKKQLIGKLKELHGLEIPPNTGIYKAIMIAEMKGSSDRYRLAKLRKEQKAAELEGYVPGIPEGFISWAGTKAPHYYVREDSDKVVCTFCGGKTDAKEVKNNSILTCPRCGSICTVRKTEKTLKGSFQATLVSGAGENRMVFRYFTVETEAGREGEKAVLCEKKRTFYGPSGKTEHYAQELSEGNHRDINFRERNPHVIKEGRSIVYCDGDIASIFGSSGFSDHVRAAEALLRAGCAANMELFMHLSGERELYLFEMLVKGRFYSLAASALERTRYRFCGSFGHDMLSGETFPGVLGIDRRAADFLRQNDGDFSMLVWLRALSRERVLPDRKVIGWILAQKLVPADFEKKPKEMTLQKSVNYVNRMCHEQYPGFKAIDVLTEWYDYLSMAEQEGKDLTDEMVYRPRELKKRHDQLVEAIAEKRLRKMEASNREAAERRRAELDAKYPGAMLSLESVRNRFEYSDGEYVIIVPHDLTEIEYEGLMLRHCVSSSSLYYERMERNETYICFLRHADRPELPYYTIEVEPGGNIRQSRSENDGQPDIEHIRGFLRKWQKHVKSNMTGEDAERAERARELGRANLAERLERFGEHDRVYMALMEDFLEAAEAV